MKLRYFQTYDANGVNSPEVLQCWDSDLECWVDVNSVRVREDKEEESLRTPPFGEDSEGCAHNRARMTTSGRGVALFLTCECCGAETHCNLTGIFDLTKWTREQDGK